MNKQDKILAVLERIADVLEFEQEQKWDYISENKRELIRELKKAVKSK